MIFKSKKYIFVDFKRSRRSKFLRRSHFLLYSRLQGSRFYLNSPWKEHITNIESATKIFDLSPFLPLKEILLLTEHGFICIVAFCCTYFSEFCR